MYTTTFSVAFAGSDWPEGKQKPPNIKKITNKHKNRSDYKKNLEKTMTILFAKFLSHHARKRPCYETPDQTALFSETPGNCFSLQ